MGEEKTPEEIAAAAEAHLGGGAGDLLRATRSWRVECVISDDLHGPGHVLPSVREAVVEAESRMAAVAIAAARFEGDGIVVGTFDVVRFRFEAV